MKQKEEVFLVTGVRETRLKELLQQKSHKRQFH